MNKEKVKALVRNLAKDKHLDAQILLRNYMLERFLERITVSEHNKKFILKGGMLIASMIGVDSRSTMDMDATIKNTKLDESIIKGILENIIKFKINDGVIMSLRKLQTIREEADYTGLRATIDCDLDGLRQVLKIDLTTGDAITPGPIEYKFDLLLEERSISIFAYNIESLLAEKLETIISRSEANTRMRDFYDVFILQKTRIKDIDKFNLKNAIKNTVETRGTTRKFNDKENAILTIENSKELKERWFKYQRTFEYAKDIEYLDLISSIKYFLL